MKKYRLLFSVIPVLLSACVPAPQVQQTPATVAAPPAAPDVVHTARYTLVSLTPDEALRYPLRQIAHHSLPASTKKHPVPTRGDALKRWLEGSGYGLCLPVTADSRQMFASPLPDVQRTLGPLRIDTALQVIAGPAWTMSVDEISRTVCFLRAPFTQTLS